MSYMSDADDMADTLGVLLVTETKLAFLLDVQVAGSLIESFVEEQPFVDVEQTVVYLLA